MLSTMPLTLKGRMYIYVTFHPYDVQSVFLALQSTAKECNWYQAQAQEIS